MSKTTYHADKVLNVMRAVTYTTFTPHFGLITAVTDIEAGTVTEASYTSYARQVGGFSAPGAGQGGRQIANDSLETFPAIDAAEGPITVPWIGIWDALTVGNLIYVLPANPTVENRIGVVIDPADVTADQIQSDGHGFVADDRVLVKAIAGASVPAGISLNTLYFVHTVATDTFELSTAAGGSGPVTITAAGAARFEHITPVTFNDNDQPKIDSGVLLVAEL
jgi:hypothetical protein